MLRIFTLFLNAISFADAMEPFNELQATGANGSIPQFQQEIHNGQQQDFVIIGEDFVPPQAGLPEGIHENKPKVQDILEDYGKTAEYKTRAQIERSKKDINELLDKQSKKAQKEKDKAKNRLKKLKKKGKS